MKEYLNTKTLKEQIESLEKTLEYLKSLLDADSRKIEPKFVDYLEEFTSLRMLANSDLWPPAVPPELICEDNESVKLERAGGILTELRVVLENKKVLDFGCGEGHVPYLAADLLQGNVVGYDLIDQNWSHFNSNPNLIFTTDFNVVKENGPYDVIIVNDVLDHTEESYKETLSKISSVLSKRNGKVYLRCHPWTSRHASHLYKQLNKAYLHLVFTPEELTKMGLTPLPTQKSKTPNSTYVKAIHESNLRILKQEKITQPLELFFTTRPEIYNRIKAPWGEKFPTEFLEVQFVDYILMSK